MKKLYKIFIISLFLCFLFVSTCQAVQIVCIGLETEREGICDIWDIVEIQDDNVQLTGPGYEPFEIIHISNMTKAEFMPVLELNEVETTRAFNDEGELVKYWYDENANPPNWYEIHIQPKYKYTLEDFTQQDLVVLDDELSTTEQKMTVINKSKDKITLYPQNSLDIMPKQK